MKSSWHQHLSLLCVRCGVVVYRSAMCIRRGEKHCPVPKAVYCEPCRSRYAFAAAGGRR
jgi:hypothetical protein